MRPVPVVFLRIALLLPGDRLRDRGYPQAAQRLLWMLYERLPQRMQSVCVLL